MYDLDAYEMMSLESLICFGPSDQVRGFAQRVGVQYPEHLSQESLFDELMACQESYSRDLDTSLESAQEISLEFLKNAPAETKLRMGVLAGTLAIIAGIAGINRMVQNHHMGNMRDAMHDDDTITRVHKMMDEVRDKDIGVSPSGWFGNRLAAAERLMKEEVQKLKHAISEKKLSPKQLVHAKELMERFRKIMHQRQMSINGTNEQRATNLLLLTR